MALLVATGCQGVYTGQILPFASQVHHLPALRLSMRSNLRPASSVRTGSLKCCEQPMSYSEYLKSRQDRDNQAEESMQTRDEAPPVPAPPPPRPRLRDRGADRGAAARPARLRAAVAACGRWPGPGLGPAPRAPRPQRPANCAPPRGPAGERQERVGEAPRRRGLPEAGVRPPRPLRPPRGLSPVVVWTSRNSAF